MTSVAIRDYMQQPENEPGSYRDRESRVFIENSHIYRALSNVAQVEWETLKNSKFFKSQSDNGNLVKTWQSNKVINPWSAVLEHEIIPFISYPYEWSFSMLKDAALLHLDLMLAGLTEGIIPKDSSAYNIQFVGSKPVFIDIGSFVKLKSGQPWIAYRQFCQMFLFPLLLLSHKNYDFRASMRGSIDGINAQDFSKFFAWTEIFKSGVLFHGFLQAKFEANASKQELKVKKETNKINFKPEFIINNVKGLRNLISNLKWKADHTTWGDYATDNSYNSTEAQLKAEFVKNSVQSGNWNLVWDLGSNTGIYSRIAADKAKYVLALDGDNLAVERNYNRLKKENYKNILPMVMNLADQSPNMGWRGLERKALAERGKPDLILCLALIHHIVISANIPLDEFIDWLAGLCKSLVIEFVTKEDDMVKILLANKEDNYHDYSQENFLNCLQKHFKIQSQQVLKGGTRTVYFCSK